MAPTQVFKSLVAGLMHYFAEEPNPYKPGAREMLDFKKTLSPAEQVEAKIELESYGYKFEANVGA